MEFSGFFVSLFPKVYWFDFFLTLVNSASPVGLQQSCDQINYLGNEVATKIHCCMTAAGDNYICVNDADAASGGLNPDLDNCITCPINI